MQKTLVSSELTQTKAIIASSRKINVGIQAVGLISDDVHNPALIGHFRQCECWSISFFVPCASGMGRAAGDMRPGGGGGTNGKGPCGSALSARDWSVARCDRPEGVAVDLLQV